MKLSESRILVVDDQPYRRQAVRMRLDRAGFFCEEATDGREALALTCSFAYDAVVTDLRIPGLHGHALWTELLRESNPPAIVIMAGINDEQMRRDLLRQGIAHVLEKVNFNTIADTLRRAIDEHKQSECRYRDEVVGKQGRPAAGD